MQLSIKSILGSALLAAMPLVFTSCGGTLDDIIGESSNPTPTATIKFTAKNEFQDADNKVPKDVTIAKLTLKSSCLPNGQLVLDDQITSPASSVTVSIPNPPSGEQSYDIVATDTEGNEWTTEGISLTLNQGNNPDKTVVLFNANHYPLTLEATENATTITVSRDNGTDNLSGIYYAIDGGAKTELAGTAQNVSLQAGQRIQFFSTKSAVGKNSNADYCLNITTDKKCYAYGNVMSLIDDEANGFHKDVTISVNDALAFLFFNNANLYNHETRAIVLPATTLKDYCYTGMFEDCTSLTSAPKLAATTLAKSCYDSMFKGCKSLTSAPKLPVKTLKERCYNFMFADCTSLTTAPQLAAKTLAIGCYSDMFQGCTKLTSAPELPAETLKEYCYAGMFTDCTSLTTAPELAAETLVEYCYQLMFKGCTKLASVTCKATSIGANSCLYNWLDGAGKEATSRTLWVRNDMKDKGTAASDGQWNSEGTTEDTRFTIKAIP